ncbi:MAG: hypothetical protein GF344_16920 [Chitinivibrionales bacterium]|nr:hypothetical protein [Chitinivibrionales bacterium]MBD3358365.1 hypothetical protein [Chitinivibrionales bacterium]
MAAIPVRRCARRDATAVMAVGLVAEFAFRPTHLKYPEALILFSGKTRTLRGNRYGLVPAT